MRVMAFYMHEQERDAAQGMMPQAEVTDSFVLGEADEAVIANMRANGLIVQELRDMQAAALPAPEAIHGKARRVALGRAMAGANAGDDTPPDFNVPQFYLVWLTGPLLESWKAELEQASVQLIEALPTGAYKVRLEPGQVNDVRQLSFVANLRIYDVAST